MVSSGGRMHRAASCGDGRGHGSLRRTSGDGPGEAIVCVLLTAAIAAYPYRGVLAAYLQGVIT